MTTPVPSTVFTAPASPPRLERAAAALGAHGFAVEILSDAPRLRSETTRSKLAQAGSARHIGAGRSRPAITVTAVAGSLGSRSLRNQPSSRASRS